MSQIPSLVEWLQAGAHFGHRTSRWHPKMKPYLFGERGGFHIMDTEQTMAKVQEAADAVRGIVARGGTVLFVGTKEQAKAIVASYAKRCHAPYVTERWLGGTITNFAQVRRSLKQLRKYKDQQEKGELRKYTKKEQLLITREVEEMEKKLGGIAEMERTPDAIFVCDMRADKTAVAEAKSSHIKIFAICDTNSDPTGVDYVIPANDDAAKTIELVCKVLCEAVEEGAVEAAQQKQVKKEEPLTIPSPSKEEAT
jgi:small subunit ribosomal protein S2